MRNGFFFLLMVISFVSQDIFSQTKLKFINNTNQLISAAYVSYSDDGNGWTSHGWYNVAAGSSKELSLGDYNYNTVYVYGFYKTTQWGSGNYQFCVDLKNAFNIANADQYCELTKKQFSVCKMVSGKVNTWTFNPAKNNLSNNNSNQNNNSNSNKPEISIYTLPGCGICEHAVTYMKEHQMKYTEYSVGDEANSKKMWELLQNSGSYEWGSTVTGPVFLIKGKVYFNVGDIDAFLSKISNQNTTSTSNTSTTSTSTTSGKNSTTKLSQQQINEFISRHNYWRAQVGSPNIVWSESLANYAYEWAKHLADEGLFEHRQPNQYGENIFMCGSCTSKTYTPKMVVDDWASEIELYHGETISNSNYSAFGHYTQVIWCQTTKVGCAMVQASNGDMIVVCNYSPHGNMIGSKPTCE
jgi:uncharacterized protein YkwD/uncharacterized membrane protein